MGKPRYEIFPDEAPNILDEVKKFFDDPKSWLETPLDALWGATPGELISTDKEVWVRDVLRRLKYGIPA